MSFFSSLSFLSFISLSLPPLLFYICVQFRRRLRVTAVEAEPSSVPPPTPDANITPAPKKPTLTKGQIVRVDKEKYLNSIEYLSVGHPTYFKGLDYIYEDRGEVLDIRFFDHGEYALLAWAGIPTAPAWLPTYMLIKSEKLSYRRM
ncbi:unnamed protein product [Sphagnum compactum]